MKPEEMDYSDDDRKTIGEVIENCICESVTDAISEVVKLKVARLMSDLDSKIDKRVKEVMAELKDSDNV